MSNSLRFEQQFDDLLASVDDPNTRAILQGLCIVARELDELNVAASDLMELPHQLKTVIHHLEQIDGSLTK